MGTRITGHGVGVERDSGEGMMGMATTWQERMHVGATYGGAAWQWSRQWGGVAWQRLQAWSQVAWRRVTRSQSVRRGALGLATLCVLCASLFAWGWNATPSVGALDVQVRAAVAAHHAPYTPYGAIAPVLSNALIAVEDEHFYAHHGVDVLGLTRAAWDDLLAGRIVEGGSTITEQLAKNAYLQGDDHSLSKKWQDTILALKVEQRYSKPQSLALYFNLAYFGDGAYGIGAASEHYFGVTPARLNLAQAALLAGLVRAPSAYDPRCNLSAAKARQDDVLMLMVADSMI